MLSYIAPQALSAQLLPYLLYNVKRAVFRPLSMDDGFVARNHRQSLTRIQKRSAGRVGEIVARSTEEIYHAVR